MRQAHFADMERYHSKAPGYPNFPLNARQLYHVISKGYVDFPAEDETDVDDRNKRDGLALGPSLTAICCILLGY